jgi:3-oxoacyl-[acyl-carrier-protein] synthase II
MAARRVAITGAGVVSPLGNSVAEFHRALAEGRSGIRRLPHDIAQDSGVQVAGLVDWKPEPMFTPAESVNIDRVAQFAIAAATEALGASRLDLSAANRDRIGVYWGTGMGGAQTLDASFHRLYADKDARVRPLTVVMAMSNAAGSNVALRYGLRGPFANYSTACSSSAMALGEAMRTIAAGRADAIVAGGSEALLTPGTLGAWFALRTLAPADAADPAASCKPFDKRRSGLVLGEGAAAFVLEDESRARARGARILGFLTGYGNSCDAVHISRPDRAGQTRAMREALAEASLEPSAIGYINAHGTATAVGDVVEAEAVNAVFGELRGQAGGESGVRVSSTKSLHGHLLGGAGALEFGVALLALEQGIIAPTGFLEQPDPACKLRHVPIKAERIEPPRAVMSNSFAFGGSNVVLIAERP